MRGSSVISAPVGGRLLPLLEEDELEEELEEDELDDELDEVLPELLDDELLEERPELEEELLEVLPELELLLEEELLVAVFSPPQALKAKQSTKMPYRRKR